MSHVQSMFCEGQCDFSPTAAPTNKPTLATYSGITFNIWNTSTVLFPRKEYKSVVGYYNGSVFMIGGLNYRKQLVQHDILHGTIIDHGVSAISA
eukprot:1059173_1